MRFLLNHTPFHLDRQALIKNESTSLPPRPFSHPLIFLPADPYYDLTEVPLYFKNSRLVPDNVSLGDLVANRAVADMNETCMVGADRAKQGQ